MAKKESRVVCFLTVAMTILAIGAPFQAAIAAQPRHVLILDQGDLLTPLTVAHTEAIRAALTDNFSQSLDIYTEGLDIDRFSSASHKKNLVEWLRNKYSQKPIDIIITEGPDALDFAIQFRQELKQDFPILFSKIGSSLIRRMRLPKKVTGVSVEWSLSRSVELASTLIPGTQKIVVLGDDQSEAINLINQEMARQFVAINLFHYLVVLNGMPVDDVIKQVASLQKDSVVLYLGITYDSTGQYYSPQSLLKSIVQKSTRPVFVVNPTLIGGGAVGGVTVNSEDGAKEVAGIAKRVLLGEDASNIPPVFIDSQKPIFDARALKRWNIDKSVLPENSELLYYQPTVWEEYGGRISAAAAALLLQTILIVALIVEYRRRRIAELKFRQTMLNYTHLNRTTALGELSASISHELNQPLAAILTNAEAIELYLCAPSPKTEDAMAAILDIQRDTQRASNIILGMRQLLRKGDIDTSPTNINKVIEEAMNFLSWRIRESDVKIAAMFAENQPLVIANTVQLSQVVLNLLTNAIESTIALNKKGTIMITTVMVAHNEVQLVVEDNGHGIPEDKIDHVFDPYYTTKAHGMGMGLSVSRTIIESLGGRLTAENINGGGACFKFSLRTVKKA